MEDIKIHNMLEGLVGQLATDLAVQTLRADVVFWLIISLCSLILVKCNLYFNWSWAFMDGYDCIPKGFGSIGECWLANQEVISLLFVFCYLSQLYVCVLAH